ncbi:MAG: hypothetical protein COA57_04550 [Flavobacteriales bacterium]|nr:MAG: hypothetical protein COA57_04550 [Flavobacteriales bacterium]
MKNIQHFDLKALKTFTNASDSSLLQYIEIYSEQTPQEISQLENSLKKNKLKELKAYAHNMKSKARYMGLESLADIAEKIEKTDASNEQISELIENFKTLFADIKTEMKHEKEKLHI